jgi:hypothetical protein
MENFFCFRRNSASRSKHLIKEFVVDKELGNELGEKEKKRNKPCKERAGLRAFIFKEKQVKKLAILEVIFAVEKPIVWQAREEIQFSVCLSVCLWFLVTWGLRVQWRIPSV